MGIIELRCFLWNYFIVRVCMCVQMIPVSVSLLVHWSTTLAVTQKTPNLTSQEPACNGISCIILFFEYISN